MSADRNHMTAHPYSQRFIYISSQFMFSSKINSTLQEKKKSMPKNWQLLACTCTAHIKLMAMEMIYAYLHHKTERTFKQRITNAQQIEKFQISDTKSNWMYSFFTIHFFFKSLRKKGITLNDGVEEIFLLP